MVSGKLHMYNTTDAEGNHAAYYIKVTRLNLMLSSNEAKASKVTYVLTIECDFCRAGEV